MWQKHCVDVKEFFMKSVPRRAEIRRSLLLEKLADRLHVEAATTETFFSCYRIPSSPKAEAHFFFGVGAETRTSGVQPRALRSFWIAENGEVIAISEPHGEEQPTEFFYYRGVKGSEEDAANMLDRLLFEFVEARDEAHPRHKKLTDRLLDGPGIARRGR
jgi:hypothetical protein